MGGSAVVIVLFVILGYCWSRHEHLWTLTDHDGHSLCRVQVGWTEQEVWTHCGRPSGRGTRPKVAGPVEGFIPQMCSAPGDVYGIKALLYGYDGKVEAVELMPAHLFIYPYP